MEIFELRYFLAVADRENIHRGSEALRISPGSLSKAITRLEDELGGKLFQRQGRNIQLTDLGKAFQDRARTIVQLEEATRQEFRGSASDFKAVIVAEEGLLLNTGIDLVQNIKHRFPKSTIEIRVREIDSMASEILRGEAHIGITTQPIPPGFKSKTIGEAKFVTAVGKGHPLFSEARKKKQISVETVLQHGFVSASKPLYGKVGNFQSSDGWRDDKFPRKIEFQSPSLLLIQEMVSKGLALAYLPDYIAEKLPVVIFKVSGCPYSCEQKITLFTNSKPQGWLNQII